MEEKQNEKTIYINNLSYKRDEEGVRRLCSRYGRVEAVKIIIDFETQTSKGMAFVEMETLGSAKKAIKGLDGARVDGRTLKAKAATPQGTKARLKTQSKNPSQETKPQEAPPKKSPKKPEQKTEKKTGLDKLFDFLKSKTKN